MNKMYVLDAAHMRRADEGTIEELGIPQEVLMERAALAVTDAVLKYSPTRVLCVCGGGNNGGDAIAVARILVMQGVSADVYLCTQTEKQKESVKKQYDIFRKIGGRTVTDTDFSEYDMIVDGIFGVGLDRDVKENYAEIIRAINRASQNGSKVIAVDIPSGINTDTGTVMGVAVKADETVSFAYHKPGHLLYPGAEYCGRVTVRDIGIRVDYLYDKTKPQAFTVSANETISLPPRKRDGNKGTFGRILIIAGSREMYGACYLSALAAFRMGAGLVDIYTHEINRQIMQEKLPEAILHTYAEDGMNEELLCKMLYRADCVVIGPGLSTDENAAMLVSAVLNNCAKTIVADADALNCISKDKTLLDTQKMFPEREIIITPHPGEFSGLTGQSISELKNNYADAVNAFAKEYRLIVVGKDAGTVVSDGNQTYFNQSGNDGMATAGSGDVLSGVIGALCASGMAGFEAAWKGVFIHGKAGDVAVRTSNTRSLMAGDIANAIKEIL